MGISGLLRVFLSTIRLLSDENFRAEYFLDQESETDFNNKSHSEKDKCPPPPKKILQFFSIS